MKDERSIPDKCRGCDARIGWVYSTNRPKPYPNVPVDWESLHPAIQQEIRDGRHIDFTKGMVSHFTTCINAGHFSKKNKKHKEDHP